MRKRKKKKSLSQIISDGWMDLRVKLIVLTTLFISVISVVIILAMDYQNDKARIENNADKYETYVDQLLLQQFSEEELTNMSMEEQKIAIDMVIDKESNRVLNAPVLRDFIIPAKEDSYAVNFKKTRESRDKWSKEDAEQFWIDLDELDLDSLGERNFEYLKAKLNDIN